MKPSVHSGGGYAQPAAQLTRQQPYQTPVTEQTTLKHVDWIRWGSIAGTLQSALLLAVGADLLGPSERKGPRRKLAAGPAVTSR